MFEMEQNGQENFHLPKDSATVYTKRKAKVKHRNI